jgi:hypothetical protein
MQDRAVTGSSIKQAVAQITLEKERKSCKKHASCERAKHEDKRAVVK